MSCMVVLNPKEHVFTSHIKCLFDQNTIQYFIQKFIHSLHIAYCIISPANLRRQYIFRQKTASYGCCHCWSSYLQKYRSASVAFGVISVLSLAL